LNLFPTRSSSDLNVHKKSVRIIPNLPASVMLNTERPFNPAILWHNVPLTIKPFRHMIDNIDFTQLAADIKVWGRELGFQQVGITDTDLGTAETRLHQWLEQGYQGTMAWLAAHGNKRSRP